MTMTSSSQETPSLAPFATDATTTRSESWLQPGDDAEAWNKARKLAVQQLDRMLKLVPKIVRSGDPDRIHDLRVASRRLQAVIDLLGGPAAPPPLRRQRRKIKRCRRIFSDVRNCDVLIEGVEKRLANRRAAHREAWSAVLEYLEQRRSEAQTRASQKLARLNFEKLYIKLQAFLAHQLAPTQFNGAGSQAALAGEMNHGLLKDRMLQMLEKAWVRFEAEFNHSHQSPTGESIHQARIAAKRVRYLAEVMVEFEVPGSREAVSWLRELQQYLGHWHDLDVAEQIMAEVLARPQFVREHLEIAADILKLIAQERKAKLHFSDKYQEIGFASGEGARLNDWAGALLAHAHPVES